MFSFLKGKSEVEKLQAKYEKLMKQSHAVSHQDRKKADALFAEAEAVAKQIESLSK